MWSRPIDRSCVPRRTRGRSKTGARTSSVLLIYSLVHSLVYSLVYSLVVPCSRRTIAPPLDTSVSGFVARPARTCVCVCVCVRVLSRDVLERGGLVDDVDGSESGRPVLLATVSGTDARAGE